MMRLAMRDQPAKSLASWPSPPPESGVALLGEFTRLASLVWVGLYLVRLTVLPQAGVGASSVFTGLLTTLWACLGFAVGSRWAAVPRRQLGLLGLALLLGMAQILRNSWVGGYFTMWSWPLWAVLCAVFAGSAQRAWPARGRYVHGVAAALLLGVLGLASVLLWLSPAGGRELHWLLRAWLSALGFYGVMSLWLWGSAGQQPMAQLRQRAAAGLLLLGLALHAVGTLSSWVFSPQVSQYAARSTAILVAITGTEALLLFLLLPGLRRHLASVFGVMAVGLAVLAAWRNGTVMAPALVFVAVLLAQQPTRRWPWTVAGWAVVMTAVATSPLIEFDAALMHAMMATAVLGLLLWLGWRLERQAALEGQAEPKALAAPSADQLRASASARRLGWAVGLTVLLLGGLALAISHQRQQADERELAQAAAQTVSDGVARRLQRAEHAAQAMAQLDPRTLDDELAFVRHASHLVGMLGPASSLQWAPQGVLRRIHPLAGQEAALGLDLLANPYQRDEAIAVVSSAQPAWTTPFELVQGGLDIVYRLPLYRDDGRFTGFVMVMLKLPQALDSLGSFSTSPYLYQVSMGKAPEAMKTAYQSPGWRGEGDAILSRMRTRCRVLQDSEASPGMAQCRQTADGQDSGADLLLDVSVQASDATAAMLLPVKVQVLLGLALLLGSGGAGLARWRQGRQAEQIRAGQIEQLQEVMGKSVVAKLLLDARGLCFWANQGAFKALHVLPQELLGVNVLEQSVARQQGWEQEARAVLADGQTRSLEYRGPWGSHMELDIRLTMDRLELAGHPVLLAQLLDLTTEHEQQRDLQRQRDNLALAQQASGLGYFEHQPAQDWSHWDVTAAAILGYPGHEQGKTLTIQQLIESIHPEDLPGLRESWRQNTAKHPYLTQRYRIYWPDRSLHWVEVSSYVECNESGKVAASRGFIKDITRDKQREAELILAREAALASARAKSEFLATMSHEIRTPMNGVLGYLELLQDQAWQLPEASRDHLRHAAQSATLLRALLDDVLDFSKIEAGKLSLAAEPLRLGPLARDVAALMRGQIGSKPVTLHLAADPQLDELVLQGDAMRIRQVLMNLLGNAIKFTEQGSVGLALLLKGVEQGRARISVAVTDTGIGMNPEQVQRLFHPFTQADGSITRRFGGTGLGLSISQSLLKLMGSEGLQVSSQPGAGSVFSFEFELPVLEEAALAQATLQQPQIGPDTLQGVDVLLVEDNRTNIELAVAVLQGMGAQVSIATNGQQALDLLERLGPDFDLVLMDMQMPVMDGLTATRAIRANPAWAQLPIVAMTANAYESDRQACLKAGMNEFLTKPLQRTRLVQVIASLLRQ